MRIGVVGYIGSGKSTFFEWITRVTPDPALAHATQSAMVEVPDARVAPLCGIYHPKKTTLASIELVDTPGLHRTHEGNAVRLAALREAGCLVVVVAAHGDQAPAADLNNFEDDLLIADLEIVSGRVERLRESLRKPRPNRDEQRKELDALEPLRAALEAGTPLRAIQLSPDQARAIRSFQLFSEKPRMVVLNTADDESDADRFLGLGGSSPTIAVPLRLQLDLERMEASERTAFCSEMGVQVRDRHAVIRQLMDASGQMLFFTAGEKEVRTWMVRKGGTALDAAAGIHTDLARGFIRAEVMTCDDLIGLGSEREVKARNRLRREPKDYVIQDGDILLIQHN
ncbi:MAG: redox-regulated ATPase YchF [Planctomycetes bacterium]|nr:redox-regulated ATPase YchF [Planctomycetota bacterium]